MGLGAARVVAAKKADRKAPVEKCILMRLVEGLLVCSSVEDFGRDAEGPVGVLANAAQYLEDCCLDESLNGE